MHIAAAILRYRHLVGSQDDTLKQYCMSANTLLASGVVFGFDLRYSFQ